MIREKGDRPEDEAGHKRSLIPDSPSSGMTTGITKNSDVTGNRSEFTQQKAMSIKYIIGIDLGTTNSVLAYLPVTEEKAVRIPSLLEISQPVAPSLEERRTSLPSFLYICTEAEAEGKSPYIIGEFARRRSAEIPDRTVVAAKSWLAHHQVDRRSPILPWGAAAEVAKISPVDASRHYLQYLMNSWNQQFPDAPIQEQKVVITVPASFDAVARDLTREAALNAGFNEELLTFLEEPQAAIYSWLAEQGDNWRKKLGVGDTILICDIGGGTSDFSLVRVEEENGDLILNRLAVGNHLLIGGDNMDLALAHRAVELFGAKGVKLNPWQSVALWHSCRSAKEALLGETSVPAAGEDEPKSYRLSILGRSSRLIGGTVSVDFPENLAVETILDGFFPLCERTDRPKRNQLSGVRELGLPFEQDTGITRHIAAFLRKQNQETDGTTCRPTHYLLNGGVFKSRQIQMRLAHQLQAWFPNEPPQNLNTAADLDHSVARGAAYYGLAKEQGGVRIRGASARSYYLGIESTGLAIPGIPRPLKALCVAPMGMEEGSECDVPSGEFGLTVGEPAVFRFFSSTSRRHDQPGALFDLNSDTEEELEETAPIEATLPVSAAETGDDGFVPVRFHTKITELGVMEVWCRDTRSDRQWKLEFSVRDE